MEKNDIYSILFGQQTETREISQYDYDREDKAKNTMLTALNKQVDNGGIPNVRAIEKQIRDLRKRAKAIENGMAIADESTLAKANAALADLTGRRKAYEQFLEDVRKRIEVCCQ